MSTAPTPRIAVPTAARGRARGAWKRLCAGAAAMSRWERGGLAGLLAGTLLLYAWALSREGWANTYYAAAVQAGTQSWKAFFFGSLDAGNLITVDKPPLSLWTMGLSARVFGLNSWSLLLPQAVAGVLTAFLVYRLVRRVSGPLGGLLAGAAMAVTPVAALIFRYDNPDAVLTLLLVLSAWAVVRGIESGATRWVVAAGAIVGLAFLTKSLQAMLVLPALALVWMVAAPGRPLRRAAQVAAGAGAMLLAGGWWVLAVELTPASARPYIGGSGDNSVLDLIFGYNGLDRLDGGGMGGGFSGEAGIARLFNDQMGGQISWLLPAAIISLAAGLWVTRRAPRTDGRRAAYLLWGAWALVHGLVFSYMTGIVHAYYTVAMAPAVAALAGMGAVELWRLRASASTRWVLPVAIAATGVWSFSLLGRTPDFAPGLRWAVLVAALGSAAVLLRDTVRLPARAAAAVATIAVAAALAGPLAYSLQTAGQSHSGGNPTAGPTVAGSFGGPGGPGGGGRGGFGGGNGPQGGTGGAPSFGGGQAPQGAAPQGGTAPQGAAPGGGTAPGGATGGGAGGAAVSDELIEFLEANRGSATWIAATGGSGSQAPLQLASGDPVMAIGGFSGGDPSPTLDQFIALVRSGKVRYYVGGGGGGGARDGGESIAAWVQENGTAVDTSLTGGATVYDLSGAVAAASGATA
ncbi:MAG: glycosyltransferase family 39 protein [Thermoleophilia bacterium]